jgi:hypothetical protein
MAEINTVRVAAVFTADSDLKVWTRLPTPLNAHLNQLAYANLVENLERVLLEDALFNVLWDEFPHVIPRQTEGHLR